MSAWPRIFRAIPSGDQSAVVAFFPYRKSGEGWKLRSRSRFWRYGNSVPSEAWGRYAVSLVHAYRYSYKKFSPICIDNLNPKPDGPRCGSSEEFLAHQMENIYMSQANRPLTLDYYNAKDALKDEIYDFLQNDVDRMEALKYFLRHEYLAMLAAHTFANTAYNPFRDYSALEAKFLEGRTVSTVPELGTVLGP